MKAYIGPYKRFYSCTLSKRWNRWRYDYEYAGAQDTWDKIIETIDDFMDHTLYAFMNKFTSKDKKVNVEIHGYDVWNVDHTLALIIHPLLVKYKDMHHGSPYVDNEDVPENLHDPHPEERYKNGSTDAHHHERWKYVLDIMIEAFRRLADQEESYDKEYNDEIEEGLRLFGKYYRALWD